MANIVPGDDFTLVVEPESFTTSGVTSLETITPTGIRIEARHNRLQSATAGGAVGGDADAGVQVEGGTGDAGEEIGGESGFTTPSAVGAVSLWTSGDNGRVSDDTRAQSTTNTQVQEYTTYGFSIPGGNTIEGIEVKLEANGDSGNSIGVELGIGTATTTSATTTATLTGSDVVYIIGGPSYTFGRTWSPEEFNDGTFVLELTANIPSAGAVNLDAVQVKVYHQAGGGGGGGGGEVRKRPERFFAAAGVVGDVAVQIVENIFGWFGNVLFGE